jgi:tRNA threonylcarbamoyladenosine biosynthesis protein TsaE
MEFMNTDQTFNYSSKNLAQSLALGEKLAKHASLPQLIELVGDLGGGKTTLVKGIAAGIGATQTVTSPTFNIHRSYEGSHGKRLEHFDLYRLEDDEIVLNELTDTLKDPNALVCVEWANHFHKHLSSDRIVIECHFLSENEREFKIAATGKTSAKAVRVLQ